MISREQDLSWINLLIGHKSPICWAFQVALVGKNLPANAEVRDVGSIPGLERFPRGGHGNPLWYSCLENPYGQRGLAGKESNTTEHAHMYLRRHFLGERLVSSSLHVDSHRNA